jgi:hypothetical protein
VTLTDDNWKKLTGSYVYNDDVGSKEGVRVITKTGTKRLTDRCG